MRISLQKCVKIARYFLKPTLVCLFWFLLFGFGFSIFTIVVFCAARGFSLSSSKSRQRISRALSSQTFWMVCHRFGVQSIIYCIDTLFIVGCLSFSCVVCVFWWENWLAWIVVYSHWLDISYLRSILIRLFVCNLNTSTDEIGHECLVLFGLIVEGLPYLRVDISNGLSDFSFTRCRSL